MTKRFSRRNPKRPPKKQKLATSTISGHANASHADSLELMAPPGLVVVCGNVGVSALNASERAVALRAVDCGQAVSAVALLNTRLDVARSTSWQVKPIELRLLEAIDTSWSRRVAARVRRGDHFLVPRALGQLVREILEYSTVDNSAPPLSPETLARLILSISSEQNSRPEFAGDVPTAAELKEVESKILSMDLGATEIAMRDMIPEEVASFLYDYTLKLEVLYANTYDTWFAPWSISISDPLLGETPAEAFAQATGVSLIDVLRLGRIIADGAGNGEIEFKREKLLTAGATADAVDLLQRSMSLDLEKYQARMVADRTAGRIGHQRYTMTQFPFVTTDNDTFVLLRYSWGIDRFFGSNLHWETYGSFLADDKKLTANTFSQAMDFMFEHQVGEALKRLGGRSRRIQMLITEKEMQDAWTDRAGASPSACDWSMLGDKTTLVIDATNHPLNAALAQGLATVEQYESDVDRTFTDRKFRQLAATIAALRSRGWVGTSVGLETDFIPLVIVPDTGLPNTTLTDYDMQRRSLSVFESFQPHVYAPAVLTRADLQLLEGIADYYPGDVIDLIGGWRHACMRNPIPIRLQDFVDQFGMQRPMSKHILKSSRQLLKLLNLPS